jgi:hypothetical protein
MKSMKNFLVTSSLLIGLLALPMQGQIPNSMYFMPGVPQSNRINPAIQPACGFYLGFPGIAPLRMQVTSSSLAVSDVIYPVEGYDSLVTPLHPLGDKQAFLDQLDDVNFLLSSLGTSIGSFGFRAGKSFLSFDITTRVDGSIFYPKGLLELPIEGAAEGNELSFGGLGVDLNVFNEFSMGWSRSDFLIPNLTLGVRGKMLFGVANLTTGNSKIDLTTSREVWNVDANVEYSAAGVSLIEFSENLDDGLPVTINEEAIDAGPLNIVREVFNMNQFGLALDAGASYRPIPQLLVSASVMDLGGINWKNTLTGSFQFEYDWVGLNVNPFTGIDTAINTFINELTDSLENSYADAFTAGDPYMSKLNPKLFVGVSYYPIEKIGFGLLSRTDFLSQRTAQQFTGSVNMTTGKFINLSLSYSYISNSFNNIGAGLSFNVGPFNMYMISDNLVSAALYPLDTRSVNLWFGLNLTFGWKKAKKREKTFDMPLIR